MKEIRNLTKEAVLISEDSSFRDAIELMVKKQTNSLLVVDGEGRLIGEVNVSDLLDAIVPLDVDGDHIDAILGTEAAFGKAAKEAEDKAVSEFMQVDIQSVFVDDTLLTIAATAIAHQTAHIPIVDHENHPLGVISRRALKHILAKYLGIKDSN
jgi:CBS domain-containing protein